MNRFGDTAVTVLTPAPSASDIANYQGPTVQGVLGGLKTGMMIAGFAVEGLLLWNSYRLFRKGKKGWGTFFAVWGLGGLAYNVANIFSSSSTAASTSAATAAFPMISVDDQPVGNYNDLPTVQIPPQTYTPPPNPTGLHPTILNRVTSIPLPANPHVNGWWNR